MRHSKTKIPASTSTPIATPTPIPALAPVDSPLLSDFATGLCDDEVDVDELVCMEVDGGV